MIKNKNKLILTICILCCTFLNVRFVEAGNATGYVVGCSAGQSCGTKIDGVSYSQGDYYDNDFILHYNGYDYRAYCPDFGKNLHASWSQTSFDCQETHLNDNQKAALSWIFSQEGNYDHWVFQIAIRMLAKDMGFMKSGAIDPYTIKGIGSKAADIDKAKSLANEAKNHTSDSNIGTVTLNMIKHSENGRDFIIKVTSNKNIDNIKFTCDRCTVTNTSWNGIDGFVQVQIDENACDFTLKAYYNDESGPMWCKSNSSGNQNLIFKLESQNQQAPSEIKVDGNPKFKQTFKMAENNSLYKAYCDDENQCLEKTTINIPSYCDDASGKQITITSPKNVVQCILNSKDDAGNTYKMDDTQIKNDNPYCSVWCKEDYNMELPGAKYSDSGRYFALEDTKVHASRSCYATGPDKNTLNIDIDKFIADVRAYQESIVDLFNQYQYEKAYMESQSTAQAEDGGNCNHDKTWYVPQEDKKYITYGLQLEDAETGVYVLTGPVEQTTLADAYGTKYRTGTNVNGQCTQSVTEAKDAKDYDYNSKLADMNEKVQRLNELIEHFEDCYNWKNILCFDPDVLFRYEELYGVDFGEKDLSTSIDANVSFKNTKVIDNDYSTIPGVPSLETRDYVQCTATGCSKSATANDISTLKNKIYYLKKESTGDATYNNRKEFATNYPYGTIEDVPTGSSGPYYDYYYLGAVFPVMFKTPTGVYNWSIKFQGIGQYNNRTTNGAPRCSTSALGRLNQVAQAIGKASIGTDLEYVCVYVVDCPECVYECSCGNNPDCVEKYENGEKFCVINGPEPECPECEIYCKNCIFDGDGATYDWRQIALDDLNPNDRKMGSNWNNEKGQATIEAIENASESIYEDSEYSYVITPTQMKNIRDYNKTIGTYINEDLSFHSQGNNVYGISEFLDKGQSLGYFNELKRNNDWSHAWSNVSEYQGPSWK